MALPLGLREIFHTVWETMDRVSSPRSAATLGISSRYTSTGSKPRPMRQISEAPSR